MIKTQGKDKPNQIVVCIAHQHSKKSPNAHIGNWFVHVHT